MHSLLSSLIFAASLGKVVAEFLTPKIPLSFLNTTIPGVSERLNELKTYDFLEFGLTALFAISLFCFHLLIKRKDSPKNSVQDIIYLIISIVVFVQVNFVTYSGKVVLVIILVTQLLYFIFRNKEVEIKFDSRKLINGIFTGFVFLLIFNLLSTSIAFSFIALVSTPFIYMSLKSESTKNPLHLLLLFAVLNPLNIKFLIILLGSVLIAAKYVKLKELEIYRYLYPIGFIFWLFYNPLYYTGNLDIVEEGIWLGWLQSMINGKLIYHDFASYHTPLLAWGLYAFTSVVGYSVKNFRLFLHLVQIVGFILIYFSFTKILKSQISRLITMLLVFSLCYLSVRNNVEIRFGVGLFSMYLLGNYFENKNSKHLFWSGLVSCISFLISIEVGIAAILTLFFCTFMFSNSRVKSSAIVLSGFLAGLVPFGAYLVVTKSLSSFLDQVVNYSSAFSKGYFNEPLERAIQTSNLRWHLIWQYFESTAFYFEFARLTLLGVGIYLLLVAYKNARSIFKPQISSLDSLHKYALSIALFSLLLSRSVLGRSDFHHILFILIPTIPLSYYLLNEFYPKDKYKELFLSLFFVFVFAGKKINENFLTQRIFTLSTYGEVVDGYKKYDVDRAGILVGKEVTVQETNELVDEIQSITEENESIFVFPWSPEVYFLANRKNATSIDIPYSFWDEKYQERIVEELKKNEPKIIVLRPGFQFGQMDANTLNVVNKFIEKNYREEKQIYSFRILKSVDAEE